MKVILFLCLMALLLSLGVDGQARKKKKNMPVRHARSSKKVSRKTMMKEMRKNLTELWSQVQTLSNPVQIHVHGIDAPIIDEEEKSHMHGHHKKKDGEHGIFGETHQHPNERPNKKQGHGHSHDEDEDKMGGTHVHIHFDLPYPKSSMSGHDVDDRMTQAQEYSYARCDMGAMKSSNQQDIDVQGFVALRQKPSHDLEIIVNLSGLPDGGRQGYLRGLHVHQYADFRGGCKSFGGHFNPHNTTHAGPTDHTRHAGDWGNVETDRSGKIEVNMTDTHSTMYGHHSIIGRGIVLHEKADDLGKGGKDASLRTGDAGGRIACCIIAVSGPGDW